MMKLVTFIFEILRLIILLALTLLILGKVEQTIYQLIFEKPIDNWSLHIGNIIIFLVIYRNYFQFNGWYKSEKNIKLNKVEIRILISISFGLITIPFWTKI